ncbi:DNA-binding protein [Streptomyces sp. NPDC093105]|uniref:nSTAND1 domain-containing NTPase n=1 Tax=Streptomyces sp. NPDC093105 TaxID=3366029 RepID=UPI003810F06A
MGRRETPVDPNAGPVQRFAYELRKLRQEADGLTYREMARRAHYSVTSLSQAAAGEHLPSLAVTLAYVAACGGDPHAWERRWRETEAEVLATRVREEEDASEAPPYQGLARFEPADHDRFFGRDELTAVLRQSVAEHRFTAVFGPSGSGKSSLLRAGLIPALRRDGHAGTVTAAVPVRLAAIRVLTPGEHPLATHAAALRARDGDGAAGDTLVVVDQFEEVYTLCRDQAERAAFIDLLLAARRPDSRLRVVIAVRADFYARCAEHRGLAGALRETSVLVGPMSQAELREVVVRPAQAAGLIVERSLTARLVREVEGRPGGLPLLSHVLRETWRRRRGRALTEEAYHAAGGLEGAIAQSAEDVHSRFSPAQADLARLLMLRLIAPGEGSQDTRRPAPRAELDIAAPGDVAHVLDRLAGARLVTLDDDTVSLAHEALITAWPRLGAWIEEDRERLRAHRRLTEAARAWDDLGRENGALYRGARLVAAEEHFRTGPGRPAALTAVEDAFLTASLAGRTRERRRRRALTGALSCLLVPALLAVGVAWQESRTSDRRRVEAEAGRLAAVAEGLRLTDPLKAMRLSVAAWRLAPTPQTRSALLGVLGQKEQDVFTLPDAAPGAADRYLTADGRSLVSVGPDRVDTWDVRTHRRTHTHAHSPARAGAQPGDEESAPWTALSPDGRTLALLEEDGVRLLDVRTGRGAGRLPVPSAMSAKFGPDGRTLLVQSWGKQFDDPADVQVWDVARRRQLLAFPLGAQETVQDSAISPDGRWLALCTDERPLEIRSLGRGPGGKPALPWLPGASKDHCFEGGFTFTADSRGIALVTGSGIRAWDLRSGRTAFRLAAPGVQHFGFSSDGRFAVAATLANEILLWRVAAPAAPVFRYTLVNETPYALRLDVAGGAIRYASSSGAIVRSLALGRAVTGGWRDRATGEAEWSPDGRLLATVGGAGDRAGYRLLDDRGRLLDELPGVPCPPLPADESSEDSPEDADGDGTAAGQGTASGEWAASGEWTAASEGPAAAEGPADAGAAPDGGTAPGAKGTAGPEGTAAGGEPEEAGPEPAAGAAPPESSCSDRLAFSPDGGYLAYGRALQDIDPDTAEPPLITVWDVRARRVLARLNLDEGATPRAEDELPLGISGIALGADGRTLAVSRAGERDVLELWDVPARKRLRTLADFSGEELVLRPDGGTAVSWADSVADLPSGRVRQRVLGSDDTTALAFSPDGTRLAAGDLLGRVTIWDGDLRTRVGSLAGTHTGARHVEDEAVSALAFSPDATVLAVAGNSGTLQLWDTTSHHLLGAPLPTPGDTIRALAFAPDGTTLRAAGAHVLVQAYDIDPDRTATSLCARLGTGLSPADWKTYAPRIAYRQTC